jgi:cation diffusion facilitator family transporter
LPSSSKKALVGAFAANLGIAITKFAVGALTRSTVMISEGIHSLVDTGNSGLMLFGRWRSRQRADAEHPFGYGMELYFWSFVVATIVFGGGGGFSIYEGLEALRHPREPTALWASYLTIGVAAAFEGASLVIGWREFRTYRKELRYDGSTLDAIRASKDPAIFLTVLEDSAALIGLALAAAGLGLRQLTGRAELEAIASILIGVVLAGEALILAIECRGLIIGEAARPVVVAELRRRIDHHAGPLHVGAVRTLTLGPESILVILELEPSDTRDGAQLRSAIQQLARALRREMPAIRHVAFSLPGTTPDAVAAEE